MQERTENKRKRILSYIHTFWLANEYGPTVEEIAQALDFPKPTINYHVIQLTKDGYLKRPRVDGRAVNRFVQITRKAKAYLND
jgi:DNA-binding MarR family transcriptional regulator